MPLAALVLLGAVLRFATVGTQKLWLDEAVTAGLVRLSPGDMLTAVPTTESTPPLYYVLARAWVSMLGTGEIALRSMSALIGTLTIPVAYAIGTTLGSRRTGLVVAVLTAVSPPLVWYSQEARSYSLLVLLCALSLLFAAKALTGGRDRDLVLWALACLLALVTHYFAGFLIAGETIWLVAAHERRRRAVLAIAGVAVGAAALVPLALRQSDQGNLDFIGEIPIGTRMVDTGQLFLAGPTGEQAAAGVALVALAAVAAGAMALRAGSEGRRTALVLLAIASGGIAFPTVLAIAGADYLLARNLLPFWVPLALVAAIGLAAEGGGRARAVALVALIAGSLWLVAAVLLDRTMQREAITAALVGGGLDAETHRIDPRIRYAVGDAGEVLRTGALCGGAYEADTGGASLRHGGDRTPVPPRRDERGWVATATPRADGSVLTVYAVCVRSRD